MPNTLGTGFYILIFTSFLLAFFVAIFPFSGVVLSLRPELICVLVIYWTITHPQNIGVLCAWGIGLSQDLVEGVTWGAHALALAIVAYICLAAHLRMKNYSIWHQSLWVFVLIGFHQVIVNWVQGLSGYKSTPADILVSTTISALLWPLVLFIMGRIRRTYQTH